MKRKILYKTLGLLAIGCVTMLSFQSCTDKFEEINTNEYNITPEELQVDFQHVGSGFVQAQENLYAYNPAWVTQLQQNLIADVYSGYMMPPTPFAGNVNNMNYSLVDGWNGFPWSWAYQNVMSPLLASDFAAGDGGEFDNFKAWAKILRVEAMHRVSDIYGPIVYSEFGQVGAKYDCQEDVYNAFFADLESAIVSLTPLINDDARPFTNFDLVYGGDYEKWIQFANSLRLRLAIRVSKVNPSLAQTEGEAALANSVGLLTSNDNNFNIATRSGATHPLNIMNNAWNDIRMGAPMESILTGYNDPRIATYFVESAEFPGEFKGIRQGIEIASKSEYENYSPLVTFGDVQLMTAAEIHFLMAEAALRGWAGAGDAQANYETGIMTSFDQHGASGADAYIADDTSTPAPYIDPKNADNDVDAGSPNLSAATIAWNDADDFETKLEKIITQKWIAMYPEGQEAWSEVRRTGYPKLFPVVINNSGGKISTEEFIKRINFPANELATNPDGVAQGLQCLGDDDDGGSALWWDID